MQRLRRHGRLWVALSSLTLAFLLSIQLGDRGVAFDLSQAPLSAQGKQEPYSLSSLKILNRVLLQLKDNYVEPQRIMPYRMLMSALDSVQHTIPEMVVAYDVTDGEQRPKRLDVTVGSKSQSFDIKNVESLWEMSFRLREIFHFVETHYKPEPGVKLEEIEYAAINGLLSTLDPHSTLLPPASYEEMQTQTGGRFGGLGIVISVRDGALTVISPIDGTPAAQKGIRAQDQIVRIGDQSTVNMNINDAVNMLRGEPGTDIDLWIMRKNWTEPRQFTLTRAIIKIDSVDSQVLAQKVGYIRIKNFQANTYSDLRTHLDRLKEKMGGMQGLVLDLRDNPGGLLDQSIRVSDLFLEQGTIVSTVGVGNKLRETKTASGAGTEPKYPIVVLVNAGSASASEIVSGALQNNDRAVVLGDTTFGKGTVQILYEFPDASALKLTIAQYLTPGDISIQSRGIVPDLYTVPVVIKDGKVDMFASQNVLREQDLDSHLDNHFLSGEQRDDVFYIRYLDPEATIEESSSEEPGLEEEPVVEDPNAFKEDFEIRLAQRLLVAAGKEWRRAQLLTGLKGELQKVYDGELGTIETELAKLRVDWSEGPSPAKPNVTLSFANQGQSATAAAGSKLTVTARLTNLGTEPVFRTKAITRSDNPALNDREFIFGKVDPGQTREWTIDLELPKDMTSRHDRIKFTVSDATAVLSQATPALDVRITGQPRPHFAFSYEVVDANGDGLVQLGEEVTFRVFVRNAGNAPSDQATVFLKTEDRDAVYLHSGREKLGQIAAGEHKAANFSFKLRSAPKTDAVPLEVDVYDPTYREFLQKKLTIPFARNPRTPSVVQGTALVGAAPAKLLVSPDEKADVVAMAPASTRLPVVARAEGWFKVQLDQRTAWMAEAAAQLQPQASEKPSPSGEVVHFQNPRVRLTPEAMMTQARQVRLTGLIDDSNTIRDYYVFVYNQAENTKVNTRKVRYVRADSASAKVDLQVPLFQGMNRITLVARNQGGMTTTESVFVYRQ